MSRNDEFWNRVDALLDDRRDPLQDAEIQHLLAEDPARLDEWVRFEAALAGAREPRRPFRRIALVASVLVLAAIGIAAWSLRAEPPPPSITAADAGRTRVISLRTTIVHIDSRGTTTTTYDGGSRAQTYVSRTPDRGAPDRGIQCFAATLLSTRNENQP